MLVLFYFLVFLLFFWNLAGSKFSTFGLPGSKVGRQTDVSRPGCMNPRMGRREATGGQGCQGDVNQLGGVGQLGGDAR